MSDKQVLIGGVLDKYREMLRERDDEVDEEEAVRIYEALLGDLVMNSKPVITDLTIIAGEQREYGEGIADVICCRIVEAPVELKLPSLYLLDSIVKNIGCEYIDYFSARLPEVFLEAYRQADPRLYPALRHLFGTWSKVFPDSVLRKIDVQLQILSDSPCSRHGIHVNPKYVEDNHRARAASSHLRSYGQLLVPHDEYDLHNSDVLKAEEQMLTATDGAGHSSTNLMANRWFTDRDNARVEPRPGRTYPRLDGSPVYNELIDPRALINAYGSDRREYNKPNWQDRPKALINAYGSDRGTDRQLHWRDDQLNIGYLNENSISHKVSARSWKNTAEVEFDWEDMSPTLADCNRNPHYVKSSQQPQEGSLSTRYEPGGLGLSSNCGFGNSNWSASVPVSALTRSTTGKVLAYQDHSGFQSSQSLINSNGQGNIQISHLANNVISSVGEDIRQLGSVSELDAHSLKPPTGALYGRLTNSGTTNGDGTGGGLVGAWPPGPMQKVQHYSSYSVIPRQKQFGQINITNGDAPVVNQLANESRLFNKQRFDATLNNVLPNQHTGPQYIRSQEGHVISGPTPVPPRPNHVEARPLHQGYISQGNTSFANNPMTNLMPRACFPNVAPPGQSFMGVSGIPQIVASQAGGGAFSGLISSLMSQGLISLSNQQDSVGVDFNSEALKVRHDSAIKALYSDLRRQCTTCGLRFSDQELHRNHMDWHVTKNRMNKNRKQKPSRKWFASASMWLSGAEASGPEAVTGFLPNETAVENQVEEEMAVPADEDQTTCGLCGEPFEDFYCHETDEWMYRGAVYLNANPGSTAGLDRSLLGPIVHAKCRPDPVTNSSQKVSTSNQSYDVDGSPAKRLRLS